MPDPRTEVYNVLSRRLTEEMVARDQAWANYWQRRRVVVVPDASGETVTANALTGGERAILVGCVNRLKVARDKDSTNRNLSTLLAVVVKVQRDLEALLNGSTPRQPKPRCTDQSGRSCS